MLSFRLLTALVATCAAAPLMVAHSAKTKTIPIGVARVDITPNFPIRLSGFGFRRKESDGITQRIWAKAMAIGNDQQGPAILITVDNLGVPDDLVEELVKRLKNAGIRRERLAVTATHTHTAPMLKNVAPTLFGQPIPKDHQKRIDRYTRELTDKLEQVARRALKNRQPASLFWAMGKVTFARNRRTKGGPVDHDLPVLVVKDPKGKIRAVYTTYACHCVTLSHNKISGDWAGYAQEIIERMHPGAVAMVSIGCGADSNPDSGVTGAKVEVARAQGALIADEVNRLLKTKLKPITATITAQQKRIALPFDRLPTKQEWAARAKRPGAVGYHARVQLARLNRGEKLPTKIDYPIQTWAFGDQLAMVFLPGEVVVDYSLRLKKELAGNRLWIHAYANDAPCYIPSERVLNEGGYEGGGAMIYYDKPTRLKPGLENKIIKEVHRQIGVPFKASDKHGAKLLSPKESRKRISVTGDLTVELIAAEPLVVDPVAIDFGPDGRLWVAELHDYPLGIDGKFKPGGRIKYLEDSDNDGKFDKATVFLDGVPFPTGVTVWRNGVLICAAPDVLYAEDTNGDGKADVQRKILTGFATHNYQARVNSLQYGLDNWVYAATGLFGGKVKSFSGKVVDLRKRDFRFQPDTGEIEPVSGVSQQGRVRDDWGNWFGCTNSALLRHYPLVDRYVARNPHVTPPSPHVLVSDSPDANRLYPLSQNLQLFKLSGPPGRVTSACGVGIYRDNLLGKSYSGNTFTCEPVNLLVHRLVLSPKGATFSGRRAAAEQKTEFLASTDTWFRPVEVRTGPDGALWVVDMYRHVIEHPRWIPEETLAKLDVRAGERHGRIYRIYPRNKQPRRIMNLTALNAAKLVAALESPNGTVRDLVQQMLVCRKDKSAVAPLRQLVRKSKQPITRLHALCTLEGLDGLTVEMLADVLEDSHPGVRRHAIRLSEPWLPKSSTLANSFEKLIGDDDPQVQLQLAYSLGSWTDPRASQMLAKLALKHHGSAYLSSAVLSSVNAENVASVLASVMQSQAPRTNRLKAQRPLLRLAATIGKRQTLARIVKELTQPVKAEEIGRQLEILADFLDGVQQRKQPLRSALTPSQQRRLHSLFTQARAIAVSGKAKEPDRVAGVQLLGREPTYRVRDITTLSRLLSPTNSVAVQTAALSSLGQISDHKVARAILKQWPYLTPSVRKFALDILMQSDSFTLELLGAIREGTVKASHLNASRRTQLLQHKNSKLRRQAEELFGRITTDRARVVEAFLPALRTRGNVVRGRNMFQKRCAVCHRVEQMGNAIGPDLTALTERSPHSLLVAMLDPNRAVEERYVTYLATTLRGQTVTGMLEEETAVSITLRDANGTKRKLLRKNLDNLVSTGISLMPVGLEKDLSNNDVADLLAYLSILPQRKQFAGNQPVIITPGEDGSFHLLATNGAIYGKEIRFEQPFRNIGYWHDENDHVIWQIRLPKASRYKACLDYACHPDSAGNRVVLEGHSSVRGSVKSTGGWDRYQRVTIGAITLVAGANTLTFRSDGKMNRRALLDLRGLHLTPITSK